MTGHILLTILLNFYEFKSVNIGSIRNNKLSQWKNLVYQPVLLVQNHMF